MTRILSALLGACAVSAAAGPAFAAIDGKTAFQPCSACHSVERGHNIVGPSLAGVVGRKVASVPNFAYSPALKAYGGVWTRARLDTFLVGPMKTVPGARMGYPGVSDPAARAAIIGYLATLH